MAGPTRTTQAQFEPSRSRAARQSRRRPAPPHRPATRTAADRSALMAPLGMNAQAFAVALHRLRSRTALSQHSNASRFTAMRTASTSFVILLALLRLRRTFGPSATNLQADPRETRSARSAVELCPDAPERIRAWANAERAPSRSLRTARRLGRSRLRLGFPRFPGRDVMAARKLPPRLRPCRRRRPGPARYRRLAAAKSPVRRRDCRSEAGMHRRC